MLHTSLAVREDTTARNMFSWLTDHGWVTETPAESQDPDETSGPSSESSDTEDATSRTDSGRTVTLPNSDVVTITTHTTIFTDRPLSTTPASSVSEPTLSSSSSRQPPQTPVPSAADGPEAYSGGQDGSTLSTAAIIGISIGGAFALAFLAILLLAVRRYRGARPNSPNDNENDDDVEEKHFPQQVSAHTTGTVGSRDPFEPFGGSQPNPQSKHHPDCLWLTPHTGRADKDPYHRESNAFEMDATSVGPAELAGYDPQVISERAPTVAPVEDSSAADPRANLNSLGSEGGKPRHVNHWNQYRAMAPGEEAGPRASLGR